MSHTHQVLARCNRCGSHTSQPQATEAAASARALALAWTRVELPFSLRLLLCPFCGMVAGRREVLLEIARSATAQAAALAPPAQEAPPDGQA